MSYKSKILSEFKNGVANILMEHHEKMKIIKDFKNKIDEKSSKSDFTLSSNNICMDVNDDICMEVDNICNDVADIVNNVCDNVDNICNDVVNGENDIVNDENNKNIQKNNSYENVNYEDLDESTFSIKQSQFLPGNLSEENFFKRKARRGKKKEFKFLKRKFSIINIIKDENILKDNFLNDDNVKRFKYNNGNENILIKNNILKEKNFNREKTLKNFNESLINETIKEHFDNKFMEIKDIFKENNLNLEQKYKIALENATMIFKEEFLKDKKESLFYKEKILQEKNEALELKALYLEKEKKAQEEIIKLREENEKLLKKTNEILQEKIEMMEKRENELIINKTIIQEEFEKIKNDFKNNYKQDVRKDTSFCEKENFAEMQRKRQNMVVNSNQKIDANLILEQEKQKLNQTMIDSNEIKNNSNSSENKIRFGQNKLIEPKRPLKQLIDVDKMDPFDLYKVSVDAYSDNEEKLNDQAMNDYVPKKYIPRFNTDSELAEYVRENSQNFYKITKDDLSKVSSQNHNEISLFFGNQQSIDVEKIFYNIEGVTNESPNKIGRNFNKKY